MKIIHSNEARKRLVCFICERDTVGHFVDTLRDFFPTGKTVLDGRKHVCVRCVRELALLFEDEFLSKEEADKVNAYVAQLEADLADAYNAENISQEIAALAEAIKDFIPATPKPKAAKKAEKAVDAPKEEAPKEEAPVTEEEPSGSAD